MDSNTPTPSTTTSAATIRTLKLSQRYPANLVITKKCFLLYWSNEVEPYTRIERFFRVIKNTNNTYICKDDFVPFLKELLHFHPGLQFLSAHDEFKRKYALTVIARIFYKVNISRTGKITYRELKASNLFTVSIICIICVCVYSMCLYV